MLFNIFSLFERQQFSVLWPFLDFLMHGSIPWEERLVKIPIINSAAVKYFSFSIFWILWLFVSIYSAISCSKTRYFHFIDIYSQSISPIELIVLISWHHHPLVYVRYCKPYRELLMIQRELFVRKLLDAGKHGPCFRSI